ncbi:hypothetical protein ACVRYP_05680 [Streptococcus rifensis]
MFKPTNLVKKAQGFLDYYEEFFKVDNFTTATGFKKLSGYSYDPTYIGQFSNIIGKANTNILFKRLSRGWFTYNYEGWALKNGVKLSGKRPDLVGINFDSKLFTLESKGWTTTGSDNKKLSAVHQSVSINIRQESGIACISQKIYNNIEVDYIDPLVGDIPIEFDIRKLIIDYYKNWQRQITEIVGNKKIDNREIVIFDYLRFLDKYYLIGIEKSCLENTDKENFYKDTFSEDENYFLEGDGIGIFLVSTKDDVLILQKFIHKENIELNLSLEKTNKKTQDE